MLHTLISRKMVHLMLGILLLHDLTVSAVNIQMVTVGNPGNPGELSGASAGGEGADRICGAVSYIYKIGKYEVTAGQYCEFLNAVAKTDTYGLYNPLMDIDNPNSSYGCNIKRSGTSGSYTYSVGVNWANRPVNIVSWGAAARFVNWLHNGQPVGNQNLSTTEDGSYYLNGANTNTQLLAVMRKANATWVLPSEDEWYKAAFHKNNGATGNYWDYPTATNSVPSNALINPDPGNNANFNVSGVYTIGEPYWRTVVGEFENSESPYGTFDQGGNVWEWKEALIWHEDVSLWRRGIAYGSYSTGSTDLHAAFRYRCGDPAATSARLGFRVVQLLPVPADVVAAFPFNASEEGWILEIWKAGTFDLGTITWDSAGGNPGGHIKSTGSGATNNTESCTREGGMMTRLISTAGFSGIQIEYDVMTSLNTPPENGCTGECTSVVLEGSCEDKLAVYYSTNGIGGPWKPAQILNGDIELPDGWFRKAASLAGLTAADNNPNLAIRFKWQFNTAADIGRIDNVTIKGFSTGTNQSPVVEAGSNQTITLPAGASLYATVTDDGLPIPPGTVTVSWTKRSGPGTVVFDDANAVDTTASFSTSGTYILRLTATDSEFTAYDELTVTVLSGKAVNPSPADGATNAGSLTVLSWTAGDGAIFHAVYFGTSSPPEYKTTQTSTTFNPGSLNWQTSYYWRIDEVNAAGTVTGDPWTFTTTSIPGDFDLDDDVDLTDFGFLQHCYSGSGVAPVAGCENADLDADNDVDQSDFGLFKNCLAGADQPPNC